MNRHGFTLIEVLTVVIIIGVLVSVALPMYTRAVERSRATEAMASIKALNDGIYAYYADKDVCPNSFKKLIVSLPGASENGSSVTSKYFVFTMPTTTPSVPGTSCHGVLATRRGNSYSYTLWNPYVSQGGKALALQCDASGDKNIAICESLGLYHAASAQE